MSLPDRELTDEGTQLLDSILHEIGASEFLQAFIDDYRDDDSLKTLSKFSSVLITSKYGLPPNKSAAFVDKCRASLLPPSLGSQYSFASNSEELTSHNTLAGTSLDDFAIMRMLGFEMIRELGHGAFGTVYEVKNVLEKLKVALKIARDPENARHAIREGQRLRRIKHKNIVLMHKVHELKNGGCALEMEVVRGGDLSKHMEACRRRPNSRLPHDTVLRFTRQLIEALVYLHDEKQWLHGDIKPQNILLQCDAASGSTVDYSSAEIKLADFGLTKILGQQSEAQSLMLSTMAGQKFEKLQGTMLYLSPEALQGVSKGGYERTFSDDLWSSCLVILEMDTGIPIQQLMNGPGSVIVDVMLTKCSPELLPLLCSVLDAPFSSRCNSASALLRMLQTSVDPMFIWQRFDVASLHYISVHPAAFVKLENAFLAMQPHVTLSLQAPLDLNFDIEALLSSPTALGLQTERSSGRKCHIRRVLKSTVLTSKSSINIWQELLDGREWRQCSPALCAKLDIDSINPNASIDSARFRMISLQSNALDYIEMPHPLKNEPYLVPAYDDDIAMLNNRLHDSLPEWDITGLVQVVNTALAAKYAGYRYQVAARCNGNPNERMMFHFCNPFVIPKIWQQGEGHDPRLSNWAEVGKGAYFAKHVMYSYAYKYKLWPSPDEYEVKSSEPPIGETMQLFASLVCPSKPRPSCSRFDLVKFP
jgi:serine/threonine protein kinase